VKFKLLFRLSPEAVWALIEWVIIYLVWKETSDFQAVLAIKCLSIIFSETEFHEEILLSPKRIAWHLLSFISYIIAFALKENGYIGISLWVTFHTVMAGIILMKIGAFHSNSRWNYIKW
jgi:hypothetical protein